jgi:ABC-type transport system substrate-binding protein
MEEMISIFSNGRGVAAQGPLPPGIFGYREGEQGVNPVVYDWRNGRAVRKPLSAAKALLVEAGYPEGRDPATGEALTLYFDAYAAGPDAKPLYNWYRKQFAKLGVRLVIRMTDYNRFQDKMSHGNAQIYAWGWNADYPDPENFLFLLYSKNGKVEHHGENASNYANSAFDRLFIAMRSLPQGPERQGLIDQMLQIVREDSPWLWGLHPQSYALSHQWYGNSKPNLMARNTLKYRRIDTARRSELRRAWNQSVWTPIILLAVGVLIVGGLAWRSWRRAQEARIG